MSDPVQPKSWRIEPKVGSDGTRAYLRLDCDAECRIPLCTEGAAFVNGVKRWGWNGNSEAPSVTPSINCGRCGWHKTITNGSAA